LYFVVGDNIAFFVRRFIRWNVQNILSYNKTFEDHNVSATAVAEYQSERNQFLKVLELI
jgi:hypothetical protein